VNDLSRVSQAFASIILGMAGGIDRFRKLKSRSGLAAIGSAKARESLEQHETGTKQSCSAGC
jgi:hypothetical protein